MSIKHGLLCLLAEGDTYGYHLKSEFEQRTGGTWPLNIGQVNTTLDRLVRDKLVEHVGEGEEGQVLYAITEQGRAEVDSWFAAPVEHTNPPRNELAIKFALAVHTPRVDITQLVQTQRRAAMERLQDLTAVRRSSSEEDLAWRLVCESMIFAVEAEIRWLDHCESEVARASRERSRGTAPARSTTQGAKARQGVRR